jgi:hypothetical protein
VLRKCQFEVPGPYVLGTFRIVSASKHEARTRETAILVDQSHAIVEKLEDLHPGRKFPLDGHLVGSLAEAAAEAIFDITLQPPSTPGHDAVSREDHRAVEIKGTYGKSGVAIRPTSNERAAALLVLRLSRTSGEPHEVVYNGPFGLAAAAAGPIGSNGQARISLSRLRVLDESVMESDRVPRRGSSEFAALDVR